MFLRQLQISQFRNLMQVKAGFDSEIVCFTGKNGSGKTNLLDSIWYLCTGKSYFNYIDSQNINHEKEYFTLKGEFSYGEESADVFIGVAKNRKKVIKENDVPVEKISQHYGKYPSVIITPYDVSLIHGGSEERRRFTDSVLSLLDREYLQWLINYERVLAQRNALLKDMAEKNQRSHSMIDVYNQELINYGNKIHAKRKGFFTEFIPVFHHYYSEISNSSEKVELRYSSQLEGNNMESVLKEQHQQDLLLQRTTAGTHKDDLELEIFAHPLKKFGSQGQQKSFLIAIKLAEFQYVKEKRNVSPLLLLDDIFDRLDNHRVANLIKTLEILKPRQVFITDTSADRIREVVPAQKDLQLFELNNGEIIAIDAK